MDNSFLTKMLEKIFNGGEHYFTDRPMRPLDEESTATPVFERTTATPIYKRPLHVTPHHNIALQNRPTIGPATTIQVVHSSGLEKCLWVALGGIGVLILMAFFMKLGKPIRRVRRHLSNARTSPVNQELGMGSHDRLVDMNEQGPGNNDPPPPYIECISINQYDIEDPPPRYSASFENYKNAEPQVHIRQQRHNGQNAPSENGVRVEFIANKLIACNYSGDIVTGKIRELVFDNGRIVERLNLYQNGNNNEIGVACNVEENGHLL